MTKGAPQIIAKLCGAETNPEMKMRVEAEVANLGSRGIRSLAVAKTAPGSSMEVRAWLPAGLPACWAGRAARLPGGKADAGAVAGASAQSRLQAASKRRCLYPSAQTDADLLARPFARFHDCRRARRAGRCWAC